MFLSHHHHHQRQRLGLEIRPGTSNNFEFGVDPSLDPELAIVLFAIDQSDVLNGFFV